MKARYYVAFVPEGTIVILALQGQYAYASATADVVSGVAGANGVPSQGVRLAAGRARRGGCTGSRHSRKERT